MACTHQTNKKNDRLPHTTFPHNPLMNMAWHGIDANKYRHFIFAAFLRQNIQLHINLPFISFSFCVFHSSRDLFLICMWNSTIRFHSGCSNHYVTSFHLLTIKDTAICFFIYDFLFENLSPLSNCAVFPISQQT